MAIIVDLILDAVRAARRGSHYIQFSLEPRGGQPLPCQRSQRRSAIDHRATATRRRASSAGSDVPKNRTYFWAKSSGDRLSGSQSRVNPRYDETLCLFSIAQKPVIADRRRRRHRPPPPIVPTLMFDLERLH